MADRFWVNGDVDGLWDNANNWSATDGGSGGAGVPGASDDVFFSSNEVSNCTVDANVSVISISFETGVGDYTGVFDADTFTVTTSGDCSTRTPYTLLMGSGAWTVGGNFMVRDAAVSGETAVITMTGSGKTFTPSNTRTDDGFFGVIIDTGASVTIPAIGPFIHQVQVKGTFIVNNNLEVNVAGGFLKVEAGATMSGNSAVSLRADNNLDVYGAGAVISVETLRWLRVTTETYAVPAGIYDTNIIIESDGGAGGCTFQFGADTVITGTLTLIQRQGSDVLTIDDSTNNPDLTIQGNVDTSGILDSANFTWTKGTGSIIFSGTSGSQTIDFDGESIDDVIINHSGTLKTFTTDLITDKVTITDGDVTFGAKLDTADLAGAPTDGPTLKFDETAAHVIDALTLSGVGSNVILRSEVDANQWDVTTTTASSVNLLDVKDGNLSGAIWTVTGGVDSGNNSASWIFMAAGMPVQAAVLHSRRRRA